VFSPKAAPKAAVPLDLVVTVWYGFCPWHAAGGGPTKPSHIQEPKASCPPLLPARPPACPRPRAFEREAEEDEFDTMAVEGMAMRRSGGPAAAVPPRPPRSMEVGARGRRGWQ
jgi:hypothetical protein